MAKAALTMYFEPGSWQEAAHDVAVGIYVGAGHGAHHAKEFVVDYFLSPLMNLFGISLEGEMPEPSDGLKVIGVGYGRTGTYSLTLALEELGIQTLHTQHLYEYPDVFEMWAKEVFQPSFDENDAKLRSPDFDVITEAGFEGTCDLPMALYFEQIYKKYPSCKFILTTRDSSEVWFRSWDTLTKSITQPVHYFSFIPNVKQLNQYFRWLFSVVNNDNGYLTAPTPLPKQNREASIHSYEEHNRRVRETIPANQLLEYNVKQGWEPLCEFLDIESCPTTPFPRSNNSRSLKVQTVSGMVVPLIVAFFVIFGLFSYLFQRATGKTLVQWANWKISCARQSLRESATGEKVPMKKLV